MSTIEKAVSAWGLPSSSDLEIVLGQRADEVALRVGDVGVNLDVVDFDLEGDGRLGAAAAALRRATASRMSVNGWFA